jgi:zinc/manganese transport system substrate-binding protein
MSKNARSLLLVWLPLVLTAILATLAVTLGQSLQQNLLASVKPSLAATNKTVRVTTSVGVWADIAAQIGGKLVTTTALVGKPGQDPHSYVATARDQLAVNQADLSIANGNGYDSFFQTLTAASVGRASNSHLVIGCHLGCDGNPHVWYSLSQVEASVPKIAHRLATAAGSQTPISQGREYQKTLAKLQGRTRDISVKASGERYLLTESFASYLLHDLKMTDATPTGFKTAVENEQDASPLVMSQIRRLLSSHRISVLITNRQTSNAQTMQITNWAKTSNVPVLKWSELLPPHTTYVQWMSANLNQIEGILK